MQGLLTIKETHELKVGYYGINSIVLTLALMALCRIKNPEQLEQHKPGELGRLIGLDRVPELKCLRKKINELVAQNDGKELNGKLLQHWVPEEEENLFQYADGHVSIYNGYLADLPAKYVSRQKLCLSATTSFWLNDQQGNPCRYLQASLAKSCKMTLRTTLLPARRKQGHRNTTGNYRLDSQHLPYVPLYLTGKLTNPVSLCVFGSNIA